MPDDPLIDEPAILDTAAHLGLTPKETLDLLSAPDIARRAAVESLGAAASMRRMAEIVLEVAEEVRTGVHIQYQGGTRTAVGAVRPCSAFRDFSTFETEKGGAKLTAGALEGKERRAAFLAFLREFRAMNAESRRHLERAAWAVLVADVGDKAPKAPTEGYSVGEVEEEKQSAVNGVARALARSRKMSKQNQSVLRGEAAEGRAACDDLDARAAGLEDASVEG